MTQLDNVCKKLDVLANTQGKNAKEAYLKVNMGDVDFIRMLQYRYDIFRVYGIKKFPSLTYALDVNTSLTFGEYTALLDLLAKSNINDALRKQAETTLSRGNYRYSSILEGIITKDLSLGVDTTVKKLLNLTEISPMLASPINEDTQIPMPCIVEKKYDGVRCLAMVEGSTCKLYTRQGRRLYFPQLEQEYVDFSGGEDITFDLELEMKARTGISGVCNSNLKSGYTKGADDFIDCYTFDEIPTAVFKALGTTKIQKERTLDLQTRFANFTGAKRIKLGESQTVSTMAKLQEINRKYIADGFEGIIVKDPKGLYAFKRNKAWLKLKAINSTTLKVIGTELGKGKRDGKVGALVCSSSCGNILVKVGSGFTDADIDLFTKTSPVGKYVEVLFNVLIKGRDSATYSLFLPRYKEMRIDKDEADSLEKVKSEHIGKIEE